MKIKIWKIKELDDTLHKNNIEEGDWFSGETKELPIVGKRFNLYGDYGVSTSPVKEILSNDTFKTYNSIYKWKYE